MKNIILNKEERIEWYRKLEQLDGKAGVYMLLDSHNEIIYIGQSTNLKKRLSVQKGYIKFKTASVLIMDDAHKALSTEAYLISIHKPKHNTQSPKIDKTNYELYSQIYFLEQRIDRLMMEVREFKDYSRQEINHHRDRYFEEQKRVRNLLNSL